MHSVLWRTSLQNRLKNVKMKKRKNNHPPKEKETKEDQKIPVEMTAPKNTPVSVVIEKENSPLPQETKIFPNPFLKME